MELSALDDSISSILGDDAIELSRPFFGEDVASEVTRQADYRILSNVEISSRQQKTAGSYLKVNFTSLTVRDAALIQNLQKNHRHLFVCLFQFVQQDDGVWFPPYSLGQLATLLEAHIARSSTDEARNGMPVVIFGHVNVDAGENQL